MVEVLPNYERDFEPCDWDALISAHRIGRMVNPGASVTLRLDPKTADALMDMINQRGADQVAVVEIEVPRAPYALDALVWGLAFYALFDLLSAYFTGLLS